MKVTSHDKLTVIQGISRLLSKTCIAAMSGKRAPRQMAVEDDDDDFEPASQTPTRKLRKFEHQAGAILRIRLHNFL